MAQVSRVPTVVYFYAQSLRRQEKEARHFSFQPLVRKTVFDEDMLEGAVEVQKKVAVK